MAAFRRFYLISYLLPCCLPLVLFGIFMGIKDTSNQKISRLEVQASSSSQVNMTSLSSRQLNMTSSQKGRRQQVLLLTYGRSGSSFTSALIRANPEVFFFFEPLKKLDLLYLEKVEDTNKTFNIWGDDKFTEAYDLMNSFFSCDPTNMSLLMNNQLRWRNDTMELHLCLKTYGYGWNHLQCYLDMRKKCLTRDITLIKSIHFRVGWTEKLLAQYPNFKLIFLIRDPRAVLHSQSRVWQHWFNWTTDLPEVASKYCQSFSRDIENIRRLKQIYPPRVKLVRYEDGAMNPHNYTRDLYKFLGLEYTEKVENLINKLTTPEGREPGGNQYSLHRDDPVKTMQNWRWRSEPMADFRTISTIDEHCGSFYNLFGYKRIDSYEHLKSQESLVSQPEGIGDIL